MARKNISWTEDQALKAAAEALKLVGEYDEGLQERFKAGLLTTLAADAETLRQGLTGRPVQAQYKEAQTGTERDLARQGTEFLSHIRQLIKDEVPAEHPLRKAVGVGKNLTSSKTTAVAAQLEAVAQAAQDYPDLFAAAGILEADIQECGSLRNALLGADAGQGEAVLSGKDLTTAKNRAQLRIENAVTKISKIGAFHHRAQPEIARRFKNLIPGGGSSGGPGNDEEPPEPPVE